MTNFVKPAQQDGKQKLVGCPFCVSFASECHVITFISVYFPNEEFPAGASELLVPIVLDPSIASHFRLGLCRGWIDETRNYHYGTGKALQS